MEPCSTASLRFDFQAPLISCVTSIGVRVRRHDVSCQMCLGITELRSNNMTFRGEM